MGGYPKIFIASVISLLCCLSDGQAQTDLIQLLKQLVPQKKTIIPSSFSIFKEKPSMKELCFTLVQNDKAAEVCDNENLMVHMVVDEAFSLFTLRPDKVDNSIYLPPCEKRAVSSDKIVLARQLCQAVTELLGTLPAIVVPNRVFRNLKLLDRALSHELGHFLYTEHFQNIIPAMLSHPDDFKSIPLPEQAIALEYSESTHLADLLEMDLEFKKRAVTYANNTFKQGYSFMSDLEERFAYMSDV